MGDGPNILVKINSSYVTEVIHCEFISYNFNLRSYDCFLFLITVKNFCSIISTLYITFTTS